MKKCRHLSLEFIFLEKRGPYFSLCLLHQYLWRGTLLLSMRTCKESKFRSPPCTCTHSANWECRFGIEASFWCSPHIFPFLITFSHFIKPASIALRYICLLGTMVKNSLNFFMQSHHFFPILLTKFHESSVFLFSISDKFLARLFPLSLYLSMVLSFSVLQLEYNREGVVMEYILIHPFELKRKIIHFQAEGESTGSVALTKRNYLLFSLYGGHSHKFNELSLNLWMLTNIYVNMRWDENILLH